MATQAEAKRAISIHAPRTGSDGKPSRTARIFASFQSTLPARGATRSPTPRGRLPPRFQSTLPARGATSRRTTPRAKRTFQSTLPARGATINPATMNGSQGISIHAPRTGSDRNAEGFEWGVSYFNPRSPHGERLMNFARRVAEATFQPTLPARGATAGGVTPSGF